MKVIIVNAVSASVGGAVTILKQFLQSAGTEAVYHVFVSDAVDLQEFSDRSNLKFHRMGKMKGLRRFYWDYLGISRFLKSRSVKPDLIVSLQNTPTGCLLDVPQVVYVHQGIPISSREWALFGKGERVFWFYKHVYPIFMRGIPSTLRYYICQAEWMREGYARLLGVPLDRVRSFAPQSSCEFPAAPVGGGNENDNERLFFYPALGYGYKNHFLIIDAMRWVRLHRPDIFPKAKVVFTLDGKSDKKIADYVNASELSESFSFSGSLQHAEVMEIFSRDGCVLLFPSEVETIGLPLLEAASHGCPIVAADLPYGRDALRGYEGVSFVSLNDVDGWGRAIVSLVESERRPYPRLKPSEKPSWKEFFSFLNEIPFRAT